MSTNRTPEEYYPKDSFERFGDDLCQLILSYLSFKECFQFECLSKQWQRLVFKNVDSLILSDKQLLKLPVRFRRLLSSVVRKCANITSIDIEINSEATERVFKVFMNSYKNLNVIHVRGDEDLDLLKVFVNHYKYELKSIDIDFDDCDTEQVVDGMIELSDLNALTKLTLRMNCAKMNVIGEPLGGMKLLGDDCKHITRLCLKFFDSIHTQLPHIQSLHIRNNLVMSPGIENCANMSTNRTQEEYYPKDSLDRFGDDLCGLLLSYLSFEDCFRFECLSKQWQRLVFKNVDTIILSEKQLMLLPIRSLRLLSLVVRKCTNITSIDIEIYSETTERIAAVIVISGEKVYKHYIH
ncbi:unnamed protein product [Oppiella nova]|uniref:F-box domain-containing protein n=1 Tax=Oppiella nova TaxID=334625 RepID=A0A7R9LR18_9ACAR|nr:unnamed protein product [Oppiella nova]CAG2166139.1 unnamed protein product [Oppiella nova]